jgi:3-(3-hydroxy-phenyl)propionate hydroxylase
MEKTSQVLICGAGPTGLTLALTLTQLGIAVRVIEKDEKPSDRSRALGVHAGTLELLGSLLGDALTQQLIARGNPTRRAVLGFGTRVPIEADLTCIPSQYNFILILAQSETEKILEAELKTRGVAVERGVALQGFDHAPAQVVARLQSQDGKSEEARAEYLVGCDGAHSKVRERLGYSFKGGTYPGTLMLADVELDWPWEHGAVRSFVVGQGAVVFFPYSKSGHYRLVIVPRVGSQASAKTETPELGEVQAWLDQAMPGQIRLLSASWISRFRVHHRMASRYGQGRVYLAGDAAHIHSPVGGQGMNIGIQDAVNLGHKLARVLKGQADPSLLASYEKERRPVARLITWVTGAVLRLALIPEFFMTRWVIQWIAPRFAGLRFLQKRLLHSISEVRTARRELEKARGDQQAAAGLRPLGRELG